MSSLVTCTSGAWDNAAQLAEVTYATGKFIYNYVIFKFRF